MISMERPEGTEALLLVRNLVKSYGNHRAVDNVSYALRPGELVALLGENGAGKTTMLQTIVGLLSPDEGTIQIAGRTVLPTHTFHKRLIGYLAERPFLYPALSGFEFLQFVGALYGLRRRESTVWGQDLLKQMHLVDIAQQRIQSYSQGMRQRLALCATLLHRPRLLLLDEPLNGLDPTHVRDLKALLLHLCSEGCSVLVSTHLLDVAERLCSRILILSHGHLVADGSLDQLRLLAKQPDHSTLEAVFFALTQEQTSQVQAPGGGQ